MNEDMEALDKALSKEKKRRIRLVHAPPSAEEFLEELERNLREIFADMEGGRHLIPDDANEERFSYLVKERLTDREYAAEVEGISAGKTDIKVEATSGDVHVVWIAESKIYTGYSKLKDGMNQLLGRYSSGQCSPIGFIIFFREIGKCKGVRNILDEWRSRLEEDRIQQCKGVEWTEDYRRNTLTSEHIEKSSGLSVDVRHWGVNLIDNPE